MALDFPASPTVGQKYPASPIAGVPTYTWDGEKWTTIGGALASGGTPATNPPLMDGVASVGTSTAYAREDHRHPSDTSLVPPVATAAEYVGNTAPTKMLTPGAVWAGATTVNLVDAASVAPDMSAGLDFAWNIGAAGRTLANPAAPKVGQKGTIRLINSSGTVTTFGSAYKFPGGAKPASTVGNIDLISYFVVDANNIYCTFNAGFA